MNEFYINGRFLTKSLTGVQRYAWEIVRNLDLLIEENFLNPKLYSFTVLAPKNIQFEPNLKHIKLKRVGFFNGTLWEQLTLPFYTLRGFLINLCNTGPLFKRKQTVTIHDAAIFATPGNFSFLFRFWYKILLPILAKLSTHILTDSEFSKSEILKYCKIKKNKISTIHLGADHLKHARPSHEVLDRFKLKQIPFILAVSSLTKNKNFKVIVESFKYLKDLKCKLLIVGKINNKIFNNGYSLFPKFVKSTGFVSDRELRTLYENALALVYPSFYEGFGLPPLEAMSLGCPAIVTKNASLPEICGEGALYCDPNDAEEIGNLIKRLSLDKKFRDNKKTRGLEIAQKYTWRKCTEELFKTLEKIINQN